MAARPKNVLLLWTDQQRADTVLIAYPCQSERW